MVSVRWWWEPHHCQLYKYCPCPSISSHKALLLLPFPDPSSPLPLFLLSSLGCFASPLMALQTHQLSQGPIHPPPPLQSDLLKATVETLPSSPQNLQDPRPLPIASIINPKCLSLLFLAAGLLGSDKLKFESWPCHLPFH